MNTEALTIDCGQIRELAEENSREMKIIIEMLFEAEEDPCEELPAYPASLTDSLILVFLGAGTYPRQPDRPFLMPACVPEEVILVFFALQGGPGGAFSMEQTHRPLSTLS